MQKKKKQQRPVSNMNNDRKGKRCTAAYPPRYRAPTSGLTSSQAEVLLSPAFKAYFTQAPLPERILNATQALRAAMMSAQATNDHVGKTHLYPVIWDSGASISISPVQSDFVGPLTPAPVGIRLQGIAKGLSIKSVGHVAWSFVDNKGMLRTLKVPAYRVPGATARLLSTTSLLQQYPEESITQLADRIILSGSKSVSGIEILTDPKSNLHMGLAYDSTAPDTIASAFSAAISTTSAHNQNLSAAEKELLRWHFRLGHLSFRKIQFLLQSGALAHTDASRRLQTASSKLHSCPLCAACQYGKQRRTTTPGKLSRTVRERCGRTGDRAR